MDRLRRCGRWTGCWNCCCGRFVRRGTLRFTTARGSVFTVGDGSGPPVAIRFMTKAAQRGVLLDPELKLGEAYMDGTLQVEQGTIADLLAIVLGQTNDGMPPNWARLQWWLRYFYRRLQQLNVPARARRNVAHHYDLDGRLYSLFLDADRQYSCAYFEAPDQSLDDAQLAKKRHLAAKLLVKDEPAHARHRLRLGRAGALSRGILPRPCHRRHAVARAMAACQRARRRKEPDPLGRFPHAGLSRPAGKIRPHRLGRHVRARRRDLLRRVFPQMRRAAGRRRRHAAAFDRPLGGAERHQSLDRQIHLPRRLYPGPVGGAALDRARRPA